MPLFKFQPSYYTAGQATDDRPYGVYAFHAANLKLQIHTQNT